MAEILDRIIIGKLKAEASSKKYYRFFKLNED